MKRKQYEKPKVLVLQVTGGRSILSSSPGGNAGTFDNGGEDGDDVETSSNKHGFWK